MALKDTIKNMNDLLASIQQNLAKAEKGNKAAAQRVRTETIQLGKIAKNYRKESVKAAKDAKKTKAKAKATKTKTVKNTARKVVAKKVTKPATVALKAKATKVVSPAKKKPAPATKSKKTLKQRSLRK